MREGDPTTESADEQVTGWAIVELLGHRTVAGQLSVVTVADVRMLRLDIPNDAPFTQFYPGGSVYCLTPTTEEIARAVAARYVVNPVYRLGLPAAEEYDPHPAAGADDDQDAPF